MKKRLIFIVLFLWLVACNNGDSVSGTATDTENTIAGVIHKTDGSIAAGANVRMFSTAVIPNADMAIVEESSSAASSSTKSRAFLETITDSVGMFKFDSILSDTFDLEVRWLLNNSVDEVVLLKNLVTINSHKTDLGNIQLKKAAYVNGLFKYDASNASLNLGSHFEIRVVGSSYQTSVLAGDSFSLGMSAGSQTLQIFPADSYMIQKLFETGASYSEIYQQVEVDVSEGDTLNLDSLVWLYPHKVVVDSSLGRIKGQVLGLDGIPKPWVNVRLIDDIYGFGFAMGQGSLNTLNTVTDSLGQWELPFPESVKDSFRIEVTSYEYGVLVAIGVSEYVNENALDNRNDTITVPNISLQEPSNFNGFVTLVADISDPFSSNCLLNSVIIGFKGTSHFVRQMTCDTIRINGLPSGIQDLLLYTGDYNVIQMLLEQSESMDAYMQAILVNLPKDDTLSQQGITYTPPYKAN